MHIYIYIIQDGVIKTMKNKGKIGKSTVHEEHKECCSFLKGWSAEGTLR